MSDEQLTLDDLSDTENEESDSGQVPRAAHIEHVAFGDLPGDWSWEMSNDHLEYIRSGISKSQNKDGDGIPVSRIETISDGVVNYNKVGYIPNEQDYEKDRLNTGDLLFSNINSREEIGKTAIYRGENPLYHGMNLLRIRYNTGSFNPFFAYYVYDSPMAQDVFFRMSKAAVGQSSINQSQMEKLYLPQPSVEEQRKIASVLYTVDQVIQKTEEIISQREIVIEGLMQDIFRYGIDSTGELRHSDEDQPYQDTKYGSAPNGWDIVPLDSIVPDDAPVTYGIVKPGDHHPGGVPVVKVENIMNGAVDQTDLLHTDPEIHDQYKRAELEEGDLLFTIRGTVGRMAFVPEELDGANLTQDTARIRIDSANSRFVRYYLETATPSNYFERHTKGQAVQGINLEDLREVPVHLPSEEEQNRIVEILDSHTEQIRTERNYRARLQRLKQGLMQDLLSGDIRTHDKAIELVDSVVEQG
jgi:type I restriction enzyme S subunit